MPRGRKTTKNPRVTGARAKGRNAKTPVLCGAVSHKNVGEAGELCPLPARYQVIVSSDDILNLCVPHYRRWEQGKTLLIVDSGEVYLASRVV
jgi:hypothetical protein